MSTTVANVLNSKALEKQLKLYEARLDVLREETDALERLKDACLLLLGTQGAAPSAVAVSTPSESSAPKSKKVKSALVQRVQELLEETNGFSEGMTIDVLCQNLRDDEAFADEKNLNESVDSILKRNPQLFFAREDGRWCSLNSGGEETIGQAANSVPA